jgi:hypothetical protein
MCAGWRPKMAALLYVRAWALSEPMLPDAGQAPTMKIRHGERKHCTRHFKI